ncbi:hypothetical protein WMY93_016125 [Mugilogobius chulae]|uniref:CASP8-associated protein 2 n=1 Tax=Mugilogobius chulae TaxID=88201 RepID=A0AAW0NYH8_9GOBI
MDSSDAPALSVIGNNEDSIDIYEGLDLGSNCKNVTPVKSVPSGLKEAMDLFEEIVTEEQLSKDASYTELKSRFQAAQSQITDLHRRLEQLELQNTGLSKENGRLKMNISILLQTARQEVTRKDEEIQRLNQQSTKGDYLQYRNQRDPDYSRQNQRLAPPPPPPVTHPPSSSSQPAPRPRLMPSKESAAPPPPPSASAAVSKPPRITDTSRNRPSQNAAAQPPPPPKETPNLPDTLPIPPPPPASPPPPPPPPPPPVSPLREDVQIALREDAENYSKPGSSSEQFSSDVATRASRKDCHTSEKHSYQTNKYKDNKHRRDLERKNNSSSSSAERHERRHSHKDQTANLLDSKRGEKKSDKDKINVSKGDRSREERRDRPRDRQSRGSDSKEHKHHRDSSRIEHRRSKDQQSREGRQTRRVAEDGKRHRRDSHSKEKHRSKEHNKKDPKPSKRSSKEKTVLEQIVSEEKSPNRKLCFMETLNLTLSPVKKTGVEPESGQKESKTAAKTTRKDNFSPPSTEDMCVIDEVDCSEPEVESRDCSQPNIEASSQKETISNISTTSVSEVVENNSVDSTSADKATNTQKDNLPKCVNGLMTDKGQKAVKVLNIPEIVISSSPTESPEPNNKSSISTSISQVMENNVLKTAEDKSEVQNVSPDIPQNTFTSSDAQSKDVSSPEATSKDTEAVSSSISLECVPQEGLSLPEAINLLTQNNTSCSSNVSPESTTAASTGVSKVSSTTQDTSALDKYAEISQTPKKSFSPAKFFSPAKSSEKCMKPTSSPSQEPRSDLQEEPSPSAKPGHVKSLQKEFSGPPPDTTSKKVDVNKENKQPGSPAKADPVALAVPLDLELEEGEILSESDETTSPRPPIKRAKLSRPIRSKGSPKCVLMRKIEEKSISVKEASDSPGAVQSPPNKSRFKTVCPAETKATFCSIEEIMDTFKLVRAEIRKKYMKLHKTFPKKSFYGVMENFQESFVEFVEGADFSQICSLPKELKSKLRKIIVSIFSKLQNNGIVKRIFEQQAVDLKQKLWDFVDGQVDFLFKDVNTALKSMCKPSRSPVERRNLKSSGKRKESPVKRKEQLSPAKISNSKPCAVVPFKTGLGSRGKGIRIGLEQSDDTDDQSPSEASAVVSLISKTPEKVNSSLAVPSNASVLDKTDFELLTEQQATSLTFNLVRDSQMGEIFKCLLQGSDLLDSSSAAADQSTWTLSTPRKDGERIITITTPGKFHSPSKLLSPNKFESPSRLITTWSSITPRKLSSPNSKILLNPALFDESCLLEVPSENKIIQRPYSILAEDLAVSLTIPSPLKSDSHLSFLQPPSLQTLSTPDSVLSAHINEDALLDEADATEHDIHLSLDTDNSSCSSNASVGSQGVPSQFLFKPDLPMQALVMEKSNDHFIVKIRQTPSANSTLIANESLSETLTEETDCQGVESTSILSSRIQNDTSESVQVCVEDNNLGDSQMKDLTKQDTTKGQNLNISKSPTSSNIPKNSKLVHQEKSDTDEVFLPAPTENSSEVISSQPSSSITSNSEREEAASESERSLTIAEELESTPEKTQARKGRDRKRKKNQGKSKAKKRKTDEDSTQAANCETSGEEPLSPNSLSAKNVVRRKGEVVMAWTRDEDRTILLELKTKGASRETFSFLSEKLDKPSSQIAQRFHQLMKLFKKQEKLDT